MNAERGIWNPNKDRAKRFREFNSRISQTEFRVPRGRSKPLPPCEKLHAEFSSQASNLDSRVRRNDDLKSEETQNFNG